MLTLRENNSLRSLSQIFTPSKFKKLIKKSDSESIEYRIKKYLGNYKSEKFSNILEFLYKELEKNYRSEYIYKNALLNQKLIAEYGLETTIVLNEFRIGASISDFVLLNGDIRIFEIKTDLDGFHKLEKQIEDYQKLANKVYVVVSSKNTNRLYEKLKYTPVGIIEFTENNFLHEFKEAIEFSENLDHITIFKALRQNEYFQIVKEFYGQIPNVPNTRMFRECLNLIKGIDIKKFQTQAREKLKQRNIKCPDLLQSEKTPDELKHICYTLNLSSSEYDILYGFLDTKI